MRHGFVLFALLISGGLAVAAPVDEVEPSVSEQEIVGRYLTAAQTQQLVLRGASMEVDIAASVPKLKKQGKLQALRNISKLGRITYHMLGFDGDSAVKKEVIARYMSAEVESQSGPNISITPENYKFKFKSVQQLDGRPVYVFRLVPRKKEVGLFKGELWLDRDTCMPVLETGRFVKNPSIFLKKMEFSREYAIRDGVAIPQHVKSVVDTRLFGPVELNIQFKNFLKDSESETVAVASAVESQN